MSNPSERLMQSPLLKDAMVRAKQTLKTLASCDHPHEFVRHSATQQRCDKCGGLVSLGYANGYRKGLRHAQSD